MKKPARRTALAGNKAKFDEIDVPGIFDEQAYALEITGDSMLPVYRQGDLIIVSPNAEIRANDRVVIKTTKGEVIARLFYSQNEDKIELAHFDPAKPTESIAPADVEWMARIIWATQ